MAEKRTLNPINLEKYAVFIDDKAPLSRYFNITELPNTFTGGKNGFLIQGSNELQGDTLVKIEIKDSNGNVIYHTPGEGNPGYYEGTSKVISVWIYPDTAFGPCTITVLGELLEYEDETGFVYPIPDEWRNRYNVRWQGKVNVRPFDPNTSKIRFVRRPKIELTEEIREVSNVIETTVTIGTIGADGQRRNNLTIDGTTPKYNYAEVFRQDVQYENDVWFPCLDTELIDDTNPALGYRCVGGYETVYYNTPINYLQLPNTSSFGSLWYSDDAEFANEYKYWGPHTSLIEDVVTRIPVVDLTDPFTSDYFIPKITKIGKENWFNYNLTLKVYNNGETIAFAANQTQWDSYCAAGTGCYRYVNDQLSNASKGYIYNYYAVNNPRGLGGVLTRIPTKADWDAMISYVGGYNQTTLNELRQRTSSGKWATTGTVTNDDGDTNISGFSGSWYQYYSGDDGFLTTTSGWNSGSAYWGSGLQNMYDSGDLVTQGPTGVVIGGSAANRKVYQISDNYGTNELGKTLYDGMFVRCVWQGTNTAETLKRVDVNNSSVILKIRPENLTNYKLYTAIEYLADEYPALRGVGVVGANNGNTGSAIYPVMDNGIYRDAYTQWLIDTGKTYDKFSPKLKRIIQKTSAIAPVDNPDAYYYSGMMGVRTKEAFYKKGLLVDEHNEWINGTPFSQNTYDTTPAGPLLVEVDSLYTWPSASHAYTRVTSYTKGRPNYTTTVLQPTNWEVFGAEYGLTSVSQSVYTSAISTSVSTIRVSDLETFTGDATRLKLYYSSRSDNQSFKLLEDIQIESNELFYTSSFKLSEFNKEINVQTGQMIQPLILSEFWTGSSLSANVTPTLATNNQIGSVVLLIPTSQSIDRNSPNSNLYKFSYTYPISFSLNTEYQLDYNAYLGTSGSIYGYSKLEVYASGSSFNTSNSNTYGKFIGSIEGTTDATAHRFLTFDKQQYSFTADKAGQGTISFIGYNTGQWEIGDLSLRASQESAFTPNEVTLVTQIPLEHNFETIDLRFELYDINNNKVPINLSAAYTLEGGNDVGRTTVIQENQTIYSQLSFGNNDGGTGDNLTIVANGALPYISMGQPTDNGGLGVGFDKPGIFIGAQGLTTPIGAPQLSLKSNNDYFLWDGDRLSIELTELIAVANYSNVYFKNLTNSPTDALQHVVMYHTGSGKLYMTSSKATGGSGAGFPFSGSAVITGSLVVSQSTNPLTIKGLQPGVSTYYLVANPTTGLISYNTAVLGAGFPYTGQAVISGSLDISGSSRLFGTMYLTGGFSSSGDIMVNDHTFGRGPSNKITNVIIGASASFSASTTTTPLQSEYNTSIGFQAGMSNTLGYNNTFIGGNAGRNATGSSNNMIGAFAGYELIAGDGNTFIGNSAGRYLDATELTFNTEANNSVFIGQNVKAGANAKKNQIAIGQRAVALGQNTSTIGNDNSKMFAIPYGVSVFGATTTPNYGGKAYEQLYVSASASINAMVIEGANNNYTQLNIKNTFAGLSSSADFTATNNIGNENQYYVNMGINNNSYTYTNSIGAANEAYLYNTGSNLWIGNATPGANGNIRFFAGNPGTTVHMFIRENGNIGIATTAPAYKLDVTGDINFTGNIYKNGTVFAAGVGGGAGTIIQNGFNVTAPGRFAVWSSTSAVTGSYHLLERSGSGIQFGDLGIDAGSVAYYYTSIPYVDSGETVTILQHTNTTVTGNNAGAGPPIKFLSTKNSAAFGTSKDPNTNFSGHLNIVTNDISRIFVTSGSIGAPTSVGAGNVGIGNGMNISQFNVTDPPKLFVSGSGSYNGVLVSTNKDGYAQFNISNTSNLTGASTDIVATANNGTEIGYYIDMGINNSGYAVSNFIGNANEAYLYNTGSNLWIGNATPGVNGNIKFFAGNTGTSTTMFISSSGNVGIGTTNPTTRLEISGSTKTRNLIISASVTTNNTLFLDDFQTAQNNQNYISGAVPFITYQAAASGTAGLNQYGFSGSYNGGTLQNYLVGQSRISTGFNRMYFMGNYTTTGINFNPQMCLNPGTIEWNFNYRANVGGPAGGSGFSGFDSTVTAGQYDYGRQGAAVVLACDNINPYDPTARGYAVTFGNVRDLETQPHLCLSKFTNGLRSNSNITPIISGSNPFNNANTINPNYYIGIKIQYNTITGQWTGLYYPLAAYSPGSTFPDPGAASAAIGNVYQKVDSTYQSASLANFGLYANVTSSGASISFDNYSLKYYPTETNALNIQTGSMIQSNGATVLANLSTLNAANDTAAAALGVPMFGLYRNGNTVQIRMQ